MLRQRGAALVEVLVSMLLSAVALLALASVNTAALRLGKMSQHRVNAALLSADIAERMRANPGGSVAGHYAFNGDWASQGSVPAPPDLCQSASSTCNSADMAALDLAQWRWQVRQLLPQGSVQLRQAPTHADVWIAWQEPAAASAAGTGAANESPAAAAECPSGLGTGGDVSVRCSHLRVHF